MGTLGWERFRIRSQRLSTVNAMDSAQIVHASHVAARALIPPASRPCCSLAPSVTTPLYSTAISRALRQPLRLSFSKPERAKFSQDSPGKERSDVCLHPRKPGADFSRGCASKRISHLLFATLPYRYVRFE